MDGKLAETAMPVLRRRGADIRASTPVKSIERGAVHLADEPIEAHTIVLAAGIVPNPVVAGIAVDRDPRGRIRIVLHWTVALFFRPDITKVELAVEQEQAARNGAVGARSFS